MSKLSNFFKNLFSNLKEEIVVNEPEVKIASKNTLLKKVGLIAGLQLNFMEQQDYLQSFLI